MPSIGASEIILILLIAFIVVGPQDLPKVARAIARGIKKLRLIFSDVANEMGINEIKSEVKNVRTEVQNTVKAVDIRADLKEAEKEIDKTLKETEKDINTQIRETKAELDRVGAEVKSNLPDPTNDTEV